MDSRGLLVVAFMMGCQGQSIEARGRFVEDGVTRVAELDWDGESIDISNAGVTPTGGLQVLSGPTGRVSATARMLAIGDTEGKRDADSAIEAAKASFTVTTAAGITAARCHHGATVRSVLLADSGCDALDVSLPLGTSEKPLTVNVHSGTGTVVVSFTDAWLSALHLEASHGAIDVTVPSRAGAVINVVSTTGHEVLLRLPADFAADTIVLEAPPAQIDSAAFPDLVLGRGRGEVGRGAKSMTVRAGRIVLVAY